ncbi:MAG: S-adenosylmethionine:tRNA ribosyltransferase-isomerase [Prolixibacteraceae bacterium]|jgi:S-adenosylmethionine:tRNA ribosyltransferase-isomerase|nr:S-adenosylmethionine:tRNA ribosyltransferase-isomerase [Prolixibacteraceae bacterium]
MNKTEVNKSISIEAFNYELPNERIAKYPLEKRDDSKLLTWKSGDIADHQFSELAELLPQKCKLVFNNTKVIRARLHFKKETGANIEIFVLDPIEPADYAQNFQQTKSCQWKCIVGNSKKWKTGKLKLQLSIKNEEIELFAENLGNIGTSKTIEFSWNNSSFTFSDILEAAGNIPIPPYLHRESEAIDLNRYQTVYSKIKGSVAAPTAGLHFTDSVFESLQKKNITTAELTLHVGAGTFQPVKSETIDGHEMHTEHIVVDKSFLQNLIESENEIIAVGTTSIRTLESLYWMGFKVYNNLKLLPENLKVEQWEPYSAELKLSRKESLQALIKYMDLNRFEQINSSTQIIIVPGYQFQIIDGMITNFHQPKSTLLLLISAFIGKDWKKIYQHALVNNYRFLSYGDSNLYLK